MPQLIAVRFCDPSTGEKLYEHDEFVVPSLKTNDEPQHREAVQIALDCMTSARDAIILKEWTLDSEGFGWGPSKFWRYIYDCTLDLGNPEGERNIWLVLFTEYRRPDRKGMEFQRLPPPRIEDIAKQEN